MFQSSIFFWIFNIVSFSNGLSGGKDLFLDVIIKKDVPWNKKFSDCFFAEGDIPWKFWSYSFCNFRLNLYSSGRCITTHWTCDCPCLIRLRFPRRIKLKIIINLWNSFHHQIQSWFCFFFWNKVGWSPKGSFQYRL